MRVVAFMQNPWFQSDTDPAIIEMYRTNQEFHRRFLAQSMSGRRLMQAFGPLYGEIWWDNASPDHVDEASGEQPASARHVEAVILDIRPALILTFGRVAERAVWECTAAIPIMVMDCHHPNARHKTQDDLNRFADKVRVWLKVHEHDARIKD